MNAYLLSATRNSLTINVMAFVTGFFLLAVWAKQLINLPIELIFAKRFSFQISIVSFFGLTFSRQGNGWSRSFDKLSPLIQIHTTIDLSKPVPEDIDKKEKNYTYLRHIICLVISLILFIVAMPLMSPVWKHTGTVLNILFLGFFSGLLFHSVTSMITSITIFQRVKKGLLGEIQHLQRRIQRGETFSSLNMKPLEELNYPNANATEKFMYYNFYCYYLLDQGRINELHNPTWEMMNYLGPKDVILQQAGLYYWIIFYFSRYEVNPEIATRFLNKCRNIIEKDQDANAKRVLAYYYYGVLGDVETARRYLQEAFAVIDKFSVPGERELERKLLQELNGYLMYK